MIRIRILRNEIVYDIDHDILFLQKVRINADDSQMNSHLFSSDADNSYRIGRWIERYWNRVLGTSSAYLVRGKQVGGGADNAVADWEVRDIVLDMPDGWPENRLQELADAVHWYIVYSVEYEFLLLAYGAGDNVVQERQAAAEDALYDIRAILSARTHGLKMPFHPF